MATLVVDGLRMRAAVSVALSASNGFWMTWLLCSEIVAIVSLKFDMLSYIYAQSVALLIKWHTCISLPVRLFVRYCALYVGNRRIHEIHLHCRLPLRPLTQVFVDAAQVLSARILNLLSTSKATHASTTTRPITEVSY